MGSKLRELREHEALTQRDIARRAGLTLNTVSRIEQDKVSARPSTVRKLADVFGVHPSVLTGK